VDFLIRTLTGSESESLETPYQGDALTLGSGGNNTVQLAALDGQIRLLPTGGGGARLGASRVGASIGGKTVHKAGLSVGDEFRVPGYRFLLLAPPQGFDLALQVEPESTGYAASMELADRLFSLRRASWIGALLVLVLSLLVPALGLLWPGVADMLRDTPLPDDGLWNSGPLAAGHATVGIAEDCRACHREPFTRVEDRACLSCHRGITEHVDIAVHDPAGFTAVRCASCHREHNEPAALVRRDTGLCIDCHAEPDRFPAAPDLAAVGAFTAADHPAFRLDLLRPRDPFGWEVVQVPQGAGGVREHSNLKFSHEVHLDAGKVQLQNSGEALRCDSCHAIQDDGEHFEPITMDRQCRSCHSLNFDIFEPDLELPHGDLRAAIVAMEAHFIREFTDPVLRRQRAADKPRRIPGKREAAATCAGTGLDCGRAEAAREVQYQFAETGCITCHEVLDTGAEDIMDRWFVLPVRITGDWLRSSRFDHTVHLNRAAANTDAVCLSCHAADESNASTDILIPEQSVCLTCHDEVRGANAVDCVGCHAFHLPRASVAAAARAPGAPQPPGSSSKGE